MKKPLRTSLLMLCLATPLTALAAGVDEAAIRATEQAGGEWLSHGRTSAEQRFSPLKQIDASNVKSLGLAWYMDLDNTRGLEATPLFHDGVIYTSVFNPYDGRKNWQDMLSAFCTTFRDTADATLVLKLTHHDISDALNDMLHHLYKNQSFRCRVVLIHGFLADADYERLVEATSFVVNSSFGEGQCLPLMEFMSCGKPAVAPCNTAMADYIDADNAFIVDSTDELTAWPHDPRRAFRTLRYVTNWASLCEAYKASYDVAKNHPARYAHRAAAPGHQAGHLHRAFSVFLFNRKGELLIQQRATALHGGQGSVHLAGGIAHTSTTKLKPFIGLV